MTVYLQNNSYGQPGFLYMPTSGITITAATTKSGTAAVNMLQPEELLYWQPSTPAGDQSVVVDFGVSTQCDSLAMLGSNMAGAELFIDGSNDNSSFSAVLGSTIISSQSCEYVSFSTANYRYYRITFNNLSSASIFYHITISQLKLLPFFDDGFAPFGISAVSQDLISPSGLFLGTVQQRSMATLDCPFSQITAAELDVFTNWSESCVKVRRPFFFIPDSASTTIYFCWTDSGYKFSPKYKNGMVDIGTIKLNSRAI